MKYRYLSYENFPSELPADIAELDSPQTLAILFGPSAAIEKTAFFQSLKMQLPETHLIGCSTAGEIHHDLIYDNSLVMAIVKFDHVSVRSTSSMISDSTESRQVGHQMAEALNSKDLRAVFVLSDGLNVNGTELVQGFNEVLGSDVVVTGGLAGDGPRFEHSWVLGRAGAASKQVVAVGLYGDQLQITHGSRGGWDKFGVVRTVTRAEGNILYELDGKPALDLYKEYLGDRASELPSSALLFPLTILSDVKDDQALVRTILSVDDDANAMIFAGDIPDGAQVQFMRANFERVIDGAMNAAKDAVNSNEGDILSIAISCVGRRLVLGQRTEEELEVVLEQFPSQTQQIGFYSYGEISPLKQGSCELHNQTMTLTTISEN